MRTRCAAAGARLRREPRGGRADPRSGARSAAPEGRPARAGAGPGSLNDPAGSLSHQVVGRELAGPVVAALEPHPDELALEAGACDVLQIQHSRLQAIASMGEALDEPGE